jgi:hypothetical protein
MPRMSNKLERAEAELRGNTSGTLAVEWTDTKEVIVLSNFHGKGMVQMHKKQKDDTSITVCCPDAISLYTQCMGDVDLADQMAGLYDLDRKSLKWWNKVFYRLLMFSAVNSRAIYKELNRQPKKPLLDFLVELAEALHEASFDVL